MSDTSRPKISPVPFILADLLFLALAAYIVDASERPIGIWQIAGLLVAVAGGAWCSFIPFVNQFKADVQLADSSALTTAVAEIQGMEAVARQIQLATSQWQTVHEQATKTSDAAKAVAERMTEEIRSFSAFMEKADAGEKHHLRLEIEKLRRGEGEWLQACVRIQDHVFALYTAAARSAQPGLTEQLGQFQNACLDALRRVGLNVFAARPEELYNPEQHNLPPDAAEGVAGTPIEGTIALGIAFQGQIVRKPMVALKTQPKAELPAPVEPSPEAPVVSTISNSLPSPSPTAEAAGDDKKKVLNPSSIPSNDVALEKAKGTGRRPTTRRSTSASDQPLGSAIEQELF